MRKKIYLRRLLRNMGSHLMCDSFRLKFGEYGVISVESGLITLNQKEAIRKVLARRLKPINGRYLVNITHFVALTKKSKGARMGKGKGSFFCEKSPIKKGHIVCEFLGIEEKEARELHKLLSKKLPIKTTIIKNIIE